MPTDGLAQLANDPQAEAKDRSNVEHWRVPFASEGILSYKREITSALRTDLRVEGLPNFIERAPAWQGRVVGFETEPNLPSLPT